MKTYRFKLYKTKKQRHLHRLVRTAGEIYNHLISVHKRYYRLYGKSIHKYTMSRHVTKIKKFKKNQHWKILGSQAIQDVVLRIDYGYQKFFNKENQRPPSYKELRKFKSFTLRQSGWKLHDDNTITIGKIKYKFWKSQELLGAPKLIHIKRDPLGDFYIFIVTDYEELASTHSQPDSSVGMDFGLKTYFVMSDGKSIESPLFYKQNVRKLAKESRALSRAKKGSKNRKKSLRNLIRVHKKTANQRKDWQFKIAKDLAKNYGAIFLEDLNTKGMKALWGRKVSDLAFYQQVQILKVQCAKTGTFLGQIGRWVPTSKSCHVCGHCNNELTLKIRNWTCVECGTSHDRDENASHNINNAGVSAFGVGTVSRSLSASSV